MCRQVARDIVVEPWPRRAVHQSESAVRGAGLKETQPFLKDQMNLKGGYGPCTKLELQWDMVSGLKFVVHFGLKVGGAVCD